MTSKHYCPSCNSAMLPGAARCRNCSWTKQTQRAASNKCERCNDRGREVYISGAKSARVLCYGHYIEIRDKDLVKAGENTQAWYKSDVICTDYDKNLENVKKQNPRLTDREAKSRAEVWTQMAYYRMASINEAAKQNEEKFYE